MKSFVESFVFLSPFLTIKYGHLSKRDVRNIKFSLVTKMTAPYLILASLLVIINAVLFISMGVETGWKTAEVYGFTSLFSQLLCMGGGVLTIAFVIVSFVVTNKNAKAVFARIASNMLFVLTTAQLFLTFYADASMGYLTNNPTLSPSIALISLLLIMQPVFWIEATIYDLSISFLLIGLSMLFSQQYQIQGIIYYIFLALLFPIISYLIVSVLFYAESQRYREALRLEALNNKAMYDELTHCKNRHALHSDLEENIKLWNFKETSLLIVMFDIDDFKLYNDQYSHLAGDYCLTAISDAIRKEFPSPDLDFYRYGGEEFLLFFENISEVYAKYVMRKIKTCIRGLNIEAAKGAHHNVVTVSVGGLLTTANGSFNYEENLALVDKNLYKAKASGKDVCVLNDRIFK